MPSGEAGFGQDGADAAELGACGAAEGNDLGRAGAVFPAGAAAAGETLGGTRSRAEAAVQTAAAVGHGRLAARAAAPGAGAATRRRQEIAGTVAVLQPAAAIGRETQRPIDPMPSGDSLAQAGGASFHPSGERSNERVHTLMFPNRLWKHL